MASLDRLPAAVNCCVVPLAMLVVPAGFTVTVDTSYVVSVTEPVAPLNEALIEVEPAVVPAAASPDASMVATAAIDDDQTAHLVKSCIAPFSRVPRAANCCVVPGAMLGGGDGVTLKSEIEETVSVADPVIPPEAAVMTVEPVVEAAVASPWLSTVAIPVSDELHAAEEERFCFVLFE